MEITQLNTVLEKKIKTYGINPVIAWLSLLNNANIIEDDIFFFQKLKKETLSYLKIRKLKQNEEKSIEAKMIIVKVCEQKTNLKIKHLAKLLSVSEQSIFYYKNVCNNRLEFPKAFAEFNQNYTEILNIVTL